MLAAAGGKGDERGGSVDLHSLRGTFITLENENGASPKSVQSVVGHATLGMTMGVYAKATDQSKRRAIGVLPYSETDAPAVLPIEEERRRRDGRENDKSRTA